MIPKIIHYCWFGSSPMPELVRGCLASWHKHMPESDGWSYRLWKEDNFDISSAPLYVRQAYEAKKYAFVSDFVRLWALEREGGLYMDVDFEVYKSFEPLLDCAQSAFVGREGSKRQPPMLGVMASEAHGEWVINMLRMYCERAFIKEDGSYDLTTNVSFFENCGVHTPDIVKIYSVDYFCPVLTTGEDVRGDNTYCEHKGLHSWSGNGGWKENFLEFVGPRWKTRIIKIKRKLFG